MSRLRVLQLNLAASLILFFEFSLSIEVIENPPANNVVETPPVAAAESQNVVEEGGGGTNKTRREMLEIGVQDMLDQWRYQVRNFSVVLYF